MFLVRMSLPVTAAVKLSWSRTLTDRVPPTSLIASLAACSDRCRFQNWPPSSIQRRTLRTSRANSNEDAADCEGAAAAATIPSWLDIDPAIVQDVVGEVTLKKFQFRQVVGEMRKLENIGFPFPEEKITRDQLETLISLRTLRCRNLYVHALSGADNRPDPEDVVRMDREWPDTMFSAEQVASVAEDEEKAARLRLAQYCEQKLAAMGQTLPAKISDRSFRAILGRSSEAGMTREIEFMIQKELDKVKDLAMKAARKYQGKHRKAAALEEKANNPHIHYGLNGNRIFHRISDNAILHFDQWRFIRESNSWGNPPIVLDLSFLKEMPPKQANSITGREIPYAISNLKRCAAPLPPIYLTSFDPKCDNCMALKDFFMIGQKNSISDFYLNISEKSYLDLFPAQNLVYMSPDSRTDLTEYSHDDVMILGAMIGKEASGHTLTKAKQEGIRHARLPMKRVLGYSAALNIDACVPVLNDFRNTKDWFYSFRWIPPRYIRTVVQGRGQSQHEHAVLDALRKLSPVDASTHDTAGLNPTAYRQRYLEYLREHLGDKASLPGPGPLFGMTAYQMEREATWSKMEARVLRREGREKERRMMERTKRHSEHFGSRRQRSFVDTMSEPKPELERPSLASERVPGAPVR